MDGVDAACAMRGFIAMEYILATASPRLLKRCTLSIVAPGVVKLVAADLGLFEVTPQGLLLQEHVPSWTPDKVNVARFTS